MSEQPSSEQKEEMPFEEAVKKLEAIVQSMEEEELALDTLLKRFEEGTQLVQLCQAKLAEAELKIEKIEKKASGEVVSTPVKLK